MEKAMEEQKALNGPCYFIAAINPNKIWESDNILANQAPLLAIQIALSTLFAHLIYHILRPFHQPRLVAELLAGFVLSPALLGGTKIVGKLLPLQGVLNIDTYAHMGVMSYVFLCGLEMNLDSILQERKKATTIAVAAIVMPAAFGMGFFALIQKVYERPLDAFLQEDAKNMAKAYIFWTLALSITGFPVLARILADLKLLYTGLGRAALTAAMISDTCGWVLFSLLLPFANDNDTRAINSVLSTILFVLVCLYVLRPLITPIIDCKTEQDTWDDSHLLFVLMGAFVCSFITDTVGTHSIIGAFVYGLILPHGKFADLLMKKLHDFVSGLMLPVFTFRSGITVNMLMVLRQKHWPLMALVVLLLSVPKVLGTLIATFFFGVPARDGVGIGLLLNSKGVLALIVLNTAWDRRILSMVAFSIMMCALVLMTFSVPLLINAIYKPRKRFELYRLRTIQKLRADAELRILTCVHSTRQAASMISILETSNATRLSPLHVFGIHLVELTGRATALLAAHMEQHNHAGAQNLTQSQAELERIANTFDAFAGAYNAVRVETSNVTSTYETIHEDIYSLAEQKRTALILLPFHEQPNAEGALETTNVAYRDINQNVLQDPPCSVAIFVDRGLGSLSRVNLRILMLFVGGPDDREALAIAWRMAGHPGIQLSVVRILLCGEAAEVDASYRDEAQGLLCATTESKRQNSLDEEYINSFRFKAVYSDESITYSETQIHGGDEITLVLNELDKNDYDLYIVGQGQGRNLAVFSKLLEWCDNSELGVIGDMVASNDFGSRSSLLVVQQYGCGGGMVFETRVGIPDKRGQRMMAPRRWL